VHTARMPNDLLAALRVLLLFLALSRLLQPRVGLALLRQVLLVDLLFSLNF